MRSMPEAVRSIDGLGHGRREHGWPGTTTATATDPICPLVGALAMRKTSASARYLTAGDAQRAKWNTRRLQRTRRQ